MLDWIYPQVVETIDSPVNGPVKVLKSRGQYSVWVGGFEQSGPIYVEKIWREALQKVPFVPQTILILGLGGGTVVPLLLQKWPNAAIIGVEIDPVMIKLGKKYFGLESFPNLKIILSDARKYQPTRKYDLVLADAYVGNKKISVKCQNFGKFVLVNSLEGTKNIVVSSDQ